MIKNAIRSSSLSTVVFCILSFALGFLFELSEVERLKAEVNGLNRSAFKAQNGDKSPAYRPVFTSPALEVPKNRNRASDSNYAEISRKELVLRRAIDRFVQNATAENGPEYTDVLTELGVTPKHLDEIKAQIADIHRSSVRTEVAMCELYKARNQYRDKLRSLIGNDNYSHYQEYESTKPARLEYKNFENYSVGKNDPPLDPDSEKRIIDLMRDNRALTDRWWHGPLDGLPKPAIGPDMIKDLFQAQIEQIKEGSTRLLDAAEASGISPDYRQRLRDYYQHEIQQRLTQIDVFSRPESMEELNQRALARDTAIFEQIQRQSSSK